MDYRIEKDSMGEVKVPSNALYGAQTQRAIENFRISGIRFPRAFIKALGLIKTAAAEVNAELGILDSATARAIKAASDEVADGKWDDHFPLDIFQTGSGTSSNMNANEVIANRAAQILGGASGSGLIHPNDHVNMGQSSNDVIPSAIHVSAYMQVNDTLLPSLKHLHTVLKNREAEFKDVVKTGRTHLMDAMPVTLGQEISGWAYQIQQGIEKIESCMPRLAKLAVGGTAVGTGINTHSEFGRRTAAKLALYTGLPFVEADNHFAAQSSMDTAAELSGHMKISGSALIKIANDLRWMNSGPVAGLGEISLPSLQPGSSIMPGKVNPVVCEAVIMACCQTMANDNAIIMGNSSGNFELNTMLPLIAHNLLQSIMLTGNSARSLADKAISGFAVNNERIAGLLEQNPILVTTLSGLVGYDKAAQIAKRAYSEKRTIKEVASEMTDIPKEDIERLLNPEAMISSGIHGGKKRGA